MEAMKSKHIEDTNLPPLPINDTSEMKDEVEEKDDDNDVDDELMRWYNYQDHEEENNFHSHPPLQPGLF